MAVFIDATTGKELFRKVLTTEHIVGIGTEISILRSRVRKLYKVVRIVAHINLDLHADKPDTEVWMEQISPTIVSGDSVAQAPIT